MTSRKTVRKMAAATADDARPTPPFKRRLYEQESSWTSNSLTYRLPGECHWREVNLDNGAETVSAYDSRTAAEALADALDAAR